MRFLKNKRYKDLEVAIFLGKHRDYREYNNSRNQYQRKTTELAKKHMHEISNNTKMLWKETNNKLASYKGEVPMVVYENGKQIASPKELF